MLISLLFQIPGYPSNACNQLTQAAIKYIITIPLVSSQQSTKPITTSVHPRNILLESCLFFPRMVIWRRLLELEHHNQKKQKDL